MNEIVIRYVHEDDLCAIAELYKEFWGENSNFSKMKVTFNVVKNNQAYIFLYASVQNRIVGTIMGVVCSELYGECKPFLVMEDLVVEQNNRRKGIGKALLQALEKIARERECYQILFITKTDRKEAILFYESLGFDSKTHIGFKKKLT